MSPPKYLSSSRSIDDSKIPLVLVACGSFSPVTYLHLRMFGNNLHVDKPFFKKKD